MKLLIVDDDINILKLLGVFLKEAGFKVIESRNGKEAFDLVLKEQPDLAIIDGLIPGIHGFELCKKIKEEPSLSKPPKIIIMSSVYKGMKYKSDVMGTYHADAYLAKPFKKEELLSAINSLLER